VAIPKIVGGKYQSTIKGSGLIWRAGPQMSSIADFRISADVKRVSGSTSSDYGVYFRRSTTDGQFAFLINDTQRAGMWYYSATNARTNLFEKASLTSILAGETNRLTVIAQGSKFTFFVNNQYVGDFTDVRLARGTAGLLISVVGDDGVFELDNFEVRAP
jgi:hypothetical protein